MISQPPVFNEIAAVDLGSNSFRLQLARVVDGHLIFHDSLREAVRLGAGLTEDNHLTEEAQQRAIACLKRFGERLRGIHPQAVRAVATNTFRVAKNAKSLMAAAESALGFPIEIIAGREEARMIFIGVSHSLPVAEHKRLVIDIGGGSTEFIIGSGIDPIEMESLYMGCVSYSLRYFPEGRLSEENFHRAHLAAATEIQIICKTFGAHQWQEAVGSSGTARALGEILRLNGMAGEKITLAGLQALRAALIKARDAKRVVLQGLSQERAAVLPGGLSIMLAAFTLLDIEEMTISSSALREGVLYELLGRLHHQDIRVATVQNFMRRYHVDRDQVKRVQKLSLELLAQISSHLHMDKETANQYLRWAGKLHEIGISIAHSGYHKHSAYIVENADMPGFSKMQQQMLGLLVRAQRRSLTKVGLSAELTDQTLLILVFRLAILFHRNRLDDHHPHLRLVCENNQFTLHVPQDWLALHPLTEAELRNEVSYWKECGIIFSVPA